MKLKNVSLSFRSKSSKLAIHMITYTPNYPHLASFDVQDRLFFGSFIWHFFHVSSLQTIEIPHIIHGKLDK